MSGLSTLGAIGGGGFGALMGQAGNLFSAPRRALWNMLGLPQHGNELVSNLTGLDKQSALAQALGMGTEIAGDPLMYTGALFGKGLGGSYAGELAQDAALAGRAGRMSSAASELGSMDSALAKAEQAYNASKAAEIGSLPQLPTIASGRSAMVSRYNPQDVQPLMDYGLAREVVSPPTYGNNAAFPTGLAAEGLVTGSIPKALEGTPAYLPSSDPGRMGLAGLPGYEIPRGLPGQPGLPMQKVASPVPGTPDYATMQYSMTPDDLQLIRELAAKNMMKQSAIPGNAPVFDYGAMVNPNAPYNQAKLMEDYLAALNQNRKMNPTIGQMQSGAPTGLPRGYPQNYEIPQYPGTPATLTQPAYPPTPMNMESMQSLLKEMPALSYMTPQQASELLMQMAAPVEQQLASRMLNPADWRNIGIAGGAAAGVGTGLGLTDYKYR